MSHSYYKRVERKRLLCLRVDGDGSADNGTTAVVGQRMINNTGTEARGPHHCGRELLCDVEKRLFVGEQGANLKLLPQACNVNGGSVRWTKSVQVHGKRKVVVVNKRKGLVTKG